MLDTKCIAEYGIQPAWSPSYLVRAPALSTLKSHAQVISGACLVDFSTRASLQSLLYQRTRLLSLQAAQASAGSAFSHDATLTHLRFRSLPPPVKTGKRKEGAGVPARTYATLSPACPALPCPTAL